MPTVNGATESKRERNAQIEGRFATVRLLPLPGVFEPPSDAWMLVRSLDEEPLGPDARVLDLCTGSGVLAIAAARRGARRVVAVDISRRAVLAARLNGRLNGVRIDARRGDLFAAVPGERFDLILSNPPYLPGSELPRRGLARAWEGGPRGRTFLERICAEAPEHMRPGGRLLLVHSSLCDETATVRELEERGLRASVIARYPGPLGPRLSSRAAWLRAQGLLGAEEQEEIVIVRASAPLGSGQGARDLQRQSVK
jgi:release factor glutamine methyltransferase